MSCCSVTSECGGNFHLEWSKFDLILNYMNCRPHVMVCLSLVHKEAEEEFSLLEMTEAFWSVIISENFSLKYHECFFVCLFFLKDESKDFPFTSQCYLVFLFCLNFFF